MSKKNTIRLTESDLKRVISESVKKVLSEGFWDGNGDYSMELFNRKKAQSFPMRGQDHEENDARIAELEMGGIRGMIRKVYDLLNTYSDIRRELSITRKWDETTNEMETQFEEIGKEIVSILDKLASYRGKDTRVDELFNDRRLKMFTRKYNR
jgi:hypothetical protein